MIIQSYFSHYGAQAVVVSIDPKRVYVSSREEAPKGKHVVELASSDTGGLGPSGERFCWWQATVKGGREARDIDAVQLAQVISSHSYVFLSAIN